MNIKIEKLIKPHLLKMKVYEPVDPPEVLAQKSGIKKENILKLNGNENPYGGSKKAIKALENAPLHIYPDPLQRKIRNSLSKYTNMPTENIIAGAGSDELIDLIFRLFISYGDNIIDFEPTFAMYGFCARIAGASIINVPRDKNFEIDIKALENKINDNTKIIFVSSPNNPTGNICSKDQVLRLLQTGKLVVIDEAYYEFSGYTVAELVKEHENLIVLRTLSKWAGLAGLRIGYALANPILINHIIDIKSPYNVNIDAEVALLASLDDCDNLIKNVELIINERNRMFNILQKINNIKPFPSYGNYILCELDEGKAKIIVDQLANNGIFVRYFNTNRLKNFFRIAIGTPSQTDILIKYIEKFLNKL